MKQATKPPGKNWARASKASSSTYITPSKGDNLDDKIIHWFKVIIKVLEDPAIFPENVYNMDETGVMLSMLSWIPGHVACLM
jgi:hypothetical protein